MASLEALIRAAAEAGELTHLSIVPVAGKGPNNVAWSASYSPASAWGTGFGHDADPVEAIKKALTDERLKKLTKQLRATLETGAPKNKRAAKAIAKNLPPEVDDSDFV